MRTRKTSAELVALLCSNTNLPSITDVNRHSVQFFPRHWLNRWNERMPAVPPILLSQEKDACGRLTLSRADLFALGSQVRNEQDAVNFYVAVCSWGAGNKARDIYRRVATLEEPNAPAKLLDGILLARDPNVAAEDAYRSFWTVSQNRLRGLGPAFFTKLLYFSAEASNTRELRHLILDQKVAAAIGWPKKTWWSPSEYDDYLRLINGLLHSLPEIERADCIEKHLFSQ